MYCTHPLALSNMPNGGPHWRGKFDVLCFRGWGGVSPSEEHTSDSEGYAAAKKSWPREAFLVTRVLRYWRHYIAVLPIANSLWNTKLLPWKVGHRHQICLVIAEFFAEPLNQWPCIFRVYSTPYESSLS